MDNQIMTKKEIADAFFDGDRELAEEVNLSQEEIDNFKAFESQVLYDNGLEKISGGYSNITIYEMEEDFDDVYLKCWAECGEFNTRESWQVKYNRTTQKFEED